MSRAALFAGKSGGLRAVLPDERDFMTFSAKPEDPLEQKSWTGESAVYRPRVLDFCTNCHQVGTELAIATVLSLRHMLRPTPLVDSRHDRWARWLTQPNVAAEKKSRSYGWGVLQGLWQSEAR